MLAFPPFNEPLAARSSAPGYTMSTTATTEQRPVTMAPPSPPSSPKKTSKILSRIFHPSSHRTQTPDQGSSSSAPARSPSPPVTRQIQSQPPSILRTSSSGQQSRQVAQYAVPNGHLAPIELVRSNDKGKAPARSTPDDKVDSMTPLDRTESRNIRFADTDDAEQQPPRPRRMSTSSRRTPSIFYKGENGYDQGVDVGAGSKARRLSVALPQEFRVDVVPLDQYFSLLNRKNPKQIGEGGAAEVQLMKARSSLSDDPAKSRDKVYAVKKFRPWEEAEETEFEYRRKIKSEYAIAKALDHPNVVKTYALCTSERGTRWHHVMEYCEYGDLNDLVNMGYMSRRDKDCMFKQLLRGVEYLHGHGIAHRDIKSENLLIASTGCLKLADFGTSEVFEGIHPGLRNCRRPSITKNDKEPKLCEPGLVGSKPYMAPEIVAHEKRYDPRAVDVWSSAIVYMSLIKGGTPWELADPVACKNYGIYAGMWHEWITEYGEDAELNPQERKLPAYANAKRGMATGGYTPEEKALILSMLHPDPEKRMKIKDALESKVVTEFECCQQDGYSDDIKKRQKKSNHNCHAPPKDKLKKHKTY